MGTKIRVLTIPHFTAILLINKTAKQINLKTKRQIDMGDFPLTFYLVSVINSSLDIPISFFYSKCLILQKICLLSCKRYKLFIMGPPIIYLDQLAFHFKVSF